MNFITKSYLLLLLFVLNLSKISEGANKNVRTSKGRVRGVLINSKVASSSQMLVFKGIPYAQAPIGPLRFKPPKTVDPWKGFKVLSNTDKPLCPQSTFYGYKGLMGYDENCLHVNVYSPSDASPSSMYPVMVWIHGGGFVAGSGQYMIYGPDHLVNEGVIVVTLNYRLGALGFLCLGTEDAPGNAGLLDQSLALKWVHDEIIHFGGNPKNVTIFGESAGSASVHFHILSNQSTGFFQRAIGQSGTALSDWAFLNTGYKERAQKLAVAVNCTTTEGYVDIDCLQNIAVEHILDHQDISLPEEDIIRGNILAFTPVLDMNISESPFFNNTLQNLILDPPNKVPIIMGTNKDEGISFISSDDEFYNNLDKKMQYFIQKQTREQIDNYTINDKIYKIIKFYFNDSMPTLENLQGYINLMTDKMFSISTEITATELSKHNEVYLYSFDFDGGFRLPEKIRTLLNLTGVSHQDELGYLFVMSQVNTENYSKNSLESKVQQNMVKLWTNFAKFGIPTQDIAGSDIVNSNWNPISTNKTNYLIINENITMSTDNYKEKVVEFWKDINTPVIVLPTPGTPSPTTPSTPTNITTSMPTNTSTSMPTNTSTSMPTNVTTSMPTNSSTSMPTNSSTSMPTIITTSMPTNSSTSIPTNSSTSMPTNSSTSMPTNITTSMPTNSSTSIPTNSSTPMPTNSSTPIPTNSSTSMPTNSSTSMPTNFTTSMPTNSSTSLPTNTSTSMPTIITTSMPTNFSTPMPASSPPTIAPTPSPSCSSFIQLNVFVLFLFLSVYINSYL